MTETVPAETRLAARRAFIRTTAQAYAATLSGGLPSAAVIVAVLQDQTGWLLAAITVGLALITPFLAGGAAYLNWLAKGIPDAYENATVAAVFKTRREAREAQG